jgi:hypothetical protein
MRILTFILFIFSALNAQAQSGNSQCINAIQICLNTPVTYPAAIDAGTAETGPDYGCVTSRPNPAWFAFRIGTPGTHTILESNSTNRDLDFILYGPFSTLSNNCANLTAANTADCSYAGGTTETIEFTSVNAGDYYLLLVTNFSNQPTNVTFDQTAGTGTYDCNFTGTCLISLVSTSASECDSSTNTFIVSGSVFTFNPPTSGTLAVSSQGVTQVINAPFNNSVNFSLSGLPSNGTNGAVTAVFSANLNCIGSGAYTSPEGCLPCQASAIANGPVCEGEALELTTDYAALAQYLWTGPNEFTSTEANPSISNVTPSATGVYTVLITGQNCVSVRDVEVDILSSPHVQINTVETDVCEGDIVFLGANDIPGASWSWTGPNEFAETTRNHQIDNATPNLSGLYILTANRGGCEGEPDSVTIIVNPKPIIEIVGDSVQTPGSAAVFSAEGGNNMVYYWNFFGDADLMDTRVFTGGSDSLIVFWQDREGMLRIEVIGEDLNGCRSEAAVLAVHVTDAVGILGLNNSSKLQIYPNPVSDFLTISTKTTGLHFVELYDVSGRNISSFSFNTSTIEMNLVDYKSGIYLLKVDGIKRLISIVK